MTAIGAEARNGYSISVTPEHGYGVVREVPHSRIRVPRVIRAHRVETAINLAAERLRFPYDPQAMRTIVEESGLVNELAGLYATLANSDRAVDFAKKSIMWSRREARKHRLQLDPDVIETARGALGTERI